MARVPVTRENLEAFIVNVANGMSRPDAAKAIGTTATRAKWALKRNPDLKPAYDAAMLMRKRNAELRRLTGVE
jgi:hypothetical protein